nr:unnamed protein product [Digitaria exilis]
MMTTGYFRAPKRLYGRKQCYSEPKMNAALLMNGEVPKGYFAVYVGAEARRFVVPTSYLRQPAFRELMERAAEEFGFNQAGGLRIPCREEDFEATVAALEERRLWRRISGARGGGKMNAMGKAGSVDRCIVAFRTFGEDCGDNMMAMGYFRAPRRLYGRKPEREQQQQREYTLLVDEGEAAAAAGAVPKGYFAVYVGAEARRFVVPTSYLSQPAFRELMERAAEEFGFDQAGGLRIPCREEDFETTIAALENSRRRGGGGRAGPTRWARCG